jgi:hypothetical protein
MSSFSKIDQNVYFHELVELSCKSTYSRSVQNVLIHQFVAAVVRRLADFVGINIQTAINLFLSH